MELGRDRLPELWQVCTGCGIDKPIEAFRTDPRNTRKKVIARCRECEGKRARAWDRANPGRKAEQRTSYYEQSRDARLRRMYGVGADEIDLLIERQGGECAICAAPLMPAGSKKIHVDHCHDTGRVRGILCLHCNVGLGHFRDSTELLAKAAEYLKKGDR